MIGVTQDKPLKRVFGVMDSYWTGDVYDDTDYSSYFDRPVDSAYKNVHNSCKSGTAKLDGYKVHINDFNDTGSGWAMIRYVIINENDYKENKNLRVKLYNCSNDELITSFNTNTSNYEPGQGYTGSVNPSISARNFEYYVKLDW